MLPRIVLLTLAPLALFAQGGLTFSYQISGAGASVALAPAGAVVYPPIAAGSASLATIYCSNQSAASYTLSASTTSPLFAASSATVQIASGSTASLDVTFTAKSPGRASAGLNLTLTPAGGVSQVTAFTLSARALDGILTSVAFASDGNQLLIPDGGTIAFPPTAPGVQSTAIFMITNRTNAAVTLDSLFLTGTAFRVTGLPLLPVALSAGGQVSVGISFSPAQAASSAGSLTYSISGVSHRIQVSGTAAASSLGFAAPDTGQPIQPGATLSFPPVAVGATAVLTLRVSNTGTATAQIPSLDASPAAFRIQTTAALPLSIGAAGSATIGISFVPQAPGTITGVLHIGDATFTLSGVGLGAQFSCTVTARGQTAGGCDGSTVTLPSVSLGDQLPITVQITNTGNQAGALQNFAIGGTGFSGSAPGLPVTLAAGSSISVNASFTPAVLGITGGFLQINGLTSNLTVAATAPPALPAISFTSVQAEMKPLQQPLVGIRLAAPYPYDLTGRLTLGFTSDSLIDDPAIQFLNGQRFIDFKVAAGTTEAIFGTSAAGVIFQTGSTAGAISLAASFTLGQYVLTASSPVTQNISIPAGPPIIRSLQIAAMDGAGFDLLVTGVSTGRSVSQLAFTLNPVQDSAFAATVLTADVASAFDAWYQSPLSRSFGGQFSVSVHFNVAGDISTIQSVTATATNAKGTSDPQSVNLQATSAQ